MATKILSAVVITVLAGIYMVLRARIARRAAAPDLGTRLARAIDLVDRLDPGSPEVSPVTVPVRDPATSDPEPPPMDPVEPMPEELTALRARLLKIAAGAGPRDAPLLARYLDHPDPQIHTLAANALGEIGDEDSLQLLLTASSRLGAGMAAPPPPELDDPRWKDLFWAEGVGPGPIPDPQDPFDPAVVTGELVRLSLDRSRPQSVRYFALVNLRAVPPPVPGPLEDLLQEAEPALRHALMELLEEMPSGPELRELVEEACRDAHRRVRLRALSVLLKLDPSRARSLLSAQARDPEPRIHELARQILEADSSPIS